MYRGYNTKTKKISLKGLRELEPKYNDYISHKLQHYQESRRVDGIKNICKPGKVPLRRNSNYYGWRREIVNIYQDITVDVQLIYKKTRHFLAHIQG